MDKNKKLTTRDIADRLATKGYTKQDAIVIVNDFISVLEEAFVSHEGIRFRGLGTFDVRDIGERMGTHPSTHEKITIPGYTTVRFIPGKKLKNEIATGFIAD